jgi:transposase-like protein
MELESRQWVRATTSTKRRRFVEPDPELLAKVKALRREKQSIRQIAKSLDLSHGTAQRWVYNLQEVAIH